MTARAAVRCAYSSVTAKSRSGSEHDTAPEAQEAGLGATGHDALVTIDEHNPGAFTFRMKVTESGALFLVLPRRDPAQPRFWCVIVVKCAPGGIIDPSEVGWLGKQGLRREEIAGTMAEIRENVNHWLTEPSQERLLAWVCTSQPTPALKDTAVNYRQKA